MDLSRILLKHLLSTKAEHQRGMKVETEYPAVWPNYTMLMVCVCYLFLRRISKCSALCAGSL